VKWAVVAAAPKMLGVRVDLESASLSILRGYVVIKGLYVHNPQGFDRYAYLAKVEMATLKVDLWEIVFTLAQRINIERLEINQVEVYLDKPSIRTSNIEAIISFIDQKLAQFLPAKAVDAPLPPVNADTEYNPDILVGTVWIRQISVIGNLIGVRLPTIYIHDIHEENFLEEGGLTKTHIPVLLGMLMSLVFNSVKRNSLDMKSYLFRGGRNAPGPATTVVVPPSQALAGIDLDDYLDKNGGSAV